MPVSELGYWQGDLNYQTGPRAGQRDYVMLGTWVAGNLTADVYLPLSGTATYTGHIIGNVENNAGNSYVAVGNYSNASDFGLREGNRNTTNFDGANYAGSTSGSPGTSNLTGNFTGTSPGATNRKGSSGGRVSMPLLLAATLPTKPAISGFKTAKPTTRPPVLSRRSAPLMITTVTAPPPRK